jgi:small-conductance mechanosensitive channel
VLERPFTINIRRSYMYMQLSPHRMSVPPPPAGYLDSHAPSSLVFVSKIVLGAIATAIAAAFIIAAPPTVMVPIASALTFGVVASLAVVGIDRRISARRSGSASSERATERATESVGLQGVLAIASVALLLVALVSPAGLRVVLASAGLLGLIGVRFGGADSGWAPRSSAWTNEQTRSQRLNEEPPAMRPLAGGAIEMASTMVDSAD